MHPIWDMTYTMHAFYACHDLVMQASACAFMPAYLSLPESAPQMAQRKY